MAVFWQQGLAGGIIFLLGWAAHALFTLYRDVQEKRIAGAQTTAHAFYANTAMMTQLPEPLQLGEPLRAQRRAL